jgi:hypothetical protein
VRGSKGPLRNKICVGATIKGVGMAFKEVYA